MGSAAESSRADELARVLVVIPTYNEVENIAAIVPRIRAAVPGAELLIVDDASPDGTGDVADQLAANDPRVHVLHRPGKDGLGVAYITGFHWGLERGYGVFVEIDADGSHHPEDLPRLLAALRDADLVLGSRWVEGGRVENWSRLREILSRWANLYAKLMLGFSLRDSTSGFRAFRRRTLEGIGLSRVASQGYCFQIDLAWRAVGAGYRVVEVPITFSERVRGFSKMDRRVVAESWWRVTAWGIGYRAEQARRLSNAGRRR